MQQSLFTEDPEPLEPNIGEIINLEGITAQCIEFDKSDDCSCFVCCFQLFPCSVYCNMINCYSIERKDKKCVVFKEVKICSE